MIFFRTRHFLLVMCVAFNCLLGGCNAKNDNIDIVNIEIDLDQQGTSISPYIYGQFIEHLGRCIYGGIWAEMLQDRKFYYPVTDNFHPWSTKTDEYWNAGAFPVLVASPWQVAGPGGSVTMDSLDAYVGDHDPVVAVTRESPSGIRQGGLALRKGKEYNGRIVVAGSEGIEKITLRVREAGMNASQTQLVVEITDPGETMDTHNFSFTSAYALDSATIELLGTGEGTFTIGTLSLMPADNVEGFRADVIDLLRELNAPIYRWPGGNFVSGYNWKDGIGAPDRRPPRKNPAWTGIEHNDVGIHEFMTFCDLIQTEPFICVNTGLGTVEEVAEELEYCNGSVETPMGAWRVENGHAAPYDVKYWAVGNEMYGDWQLGHMPLSEYVKKHNAVASAMWAIDPDIRLVAVGNVGEWSEMMMQECADHMNLISEHIYEQEKDDVVAHSQMLSRGIKAKADAHRKYRTEIPGLAEKDIRLAMDEWNHWYGDYIYGELGVRYHLKDALGIATGLHEYFRNSDMYFMANYAQTVNVIGAIKTTKTEAEFATTGLALKLYRNHFETVPVAVEYAHEDLDIFAAVDADIKEVTLGVINPTTDPQRMVVSGLPEEYSASTCYVIASDDPMAYNEPGKPRQVDIVQSDFDVRDMSVKPFSICLFIFDMIEE